MIMKSVLTFISTSNRNRKTSLDKSPELASLPMRIFGDLLVLLEYLFELNFKIIFNKNLSNKYIIVKRYKVFGSTYSSRVVYFT